MVDSERRRIVCSLEFNAQHRFTIALISNGEIFSEAHSTFSQLDESQIVYGIQSANECAIVSEQLCVFTDPLSQ